MMLAVSQYQQVLLSFSVASPIQTLNDWPVPAVTLAPVSNGGSPSNGPELLCHQRPLSSRSSSGVSGPSLPLLSIQLVKTLPETLEEINDCEPSSVL